jgi:hypothetical protein
LLINTCNLCIGQYYRLMFLVNKNSCIISKGVFPMVGAGEKVSFRWSVYSETLTLRSINPRFLYFYVRFIRHANFCKWYGVYSLNFRLSFSRIFLITRLDWKYVGTKFNFRLWIVSTTVFKFAYYIWSVTSAR